MRPKYLVTILVFLALAAPTSPAHAGGIVSVCDEAHLLAALAGGGTVTFSCSGTITLTAEITIAANTTIDGSGQTITISGNHAVRVFTVNSGVALNLNSLTVANGSTTGDGGSISNLGTLTVSNSTFSGNIASGGGGGISNLGMVTVSNSTFSGNSAGSGGGILNWDHNTVTVSNSIFSGNSAGSGGGIYNYNVVTVSNSTFSGNSAGEGGGISNHNWATVSSSTFSGNSASEKGGGIHNHGTLTVSNSTFSGNSASSYGGGIDNFLIRTVTVSNSTFSGNTATQGGGIRNFGGTVTIKNTMVANSPAGGNCYGDPITDGGGNLSYPDTTCPGIHSDPLLGPLQNNGGPTETMALGPGSAALDAANDAICAATPVNNLDQRGVARPQGPHCDIGAVEQIQQPAAVSLTALSARSLPGTIPPTIIVGLLLAAWVGVGIRRRLHMT
jgi:predicted outer membrane repeat protein